VSLLASLTHAVPYTAGYPSVISQEAQLVFGSGVVGHVLYIVVQTATALVLYTGANTSFNGFLFSASFVAEDAFLRANIGDDLPRGELRRPCQHAQ